MTTLCISEELEYTARDLRDELAQIRAVQELLEEMWALGVRRPEYDLASPYDRRAFAPEFDRCEVPGAYPG